MSTYVKLTLAATALALQDANISDPTAFAANCSAILGTLHGSSDYCHQYYGQIVQQGLIGANPMLFAEGVPNAAAAHLSLMLSLKGACQTIIGTRTAALDALRLASLRISAGHWDRAIVSAGEESYPTVDAAYRHSGLHAPSPELASPPFNGQHGFLTGAGAVTLILESEDSLAQRNATKSHARILAANSTRATAPDRSDLPTRIRDLLSSLPNPTAPTLSSANGTWIDHAELAAIRSLSPTTPVSTLYGHTPELFATTPLASLAATLLTGHLPPLVGAPQSPGCTSEASTPTPDPPLSTFTTLATDYTALTTAIHLERTP